MCFGLVIVAFCTDDNPSVFSDRDIPAPNIDLHRVHCARNLEKCKICGDMVPKKHAQEHFSNTHAPVHILFFYSFFEMIYFLFMTFPLELC